MSSSMELSRGSSGFLAKFLAEVQTLPEEVNTALQRITAIDSECVRLNLECGAMEVKLIQDFGQQLQAVDDEHSAAIAATAASQAAASVAAAGIAAAGDDAAAAASPGSGAAVAAVDETSLAAPATAVATPAAATAPAAPLAGQSNSIARTMSSNIATTRPLFPLYSDTDAAAADAAAATAATAAADPLSSSSSSLVPLSTPISAPANLAELPTAHDTKRRKVLPDLPVEVVAAVPASLAAELAEYHGKRQRIAELNTEKVTLAASAQASVGAQLQRLDVDLIKLEHVVKVRGKHFNGSAGNGRASHGGGGGRSSSSGANSGKSRSNSGASTSSSSSGIGSSSSGVGTSHPGLLPQAQSESAAPGVHFSASLAATNTFGSGATTAPGFAPNETSVVAEGANGVAMNGVVSEGLQQQQHPMLFPHDPSLAPGGASEAINPASLEPFCICRRPSYGEMVGCDGETCKVEWFHYACVGLVAEPEGDWYCRECREKRRRSIQKIKDQKRKR